MYYYRVFGLTIESCIPFLQPEEEPGLPDVTIRYGTPPSSLAAARSRGARFQVAPGEVLLTIKGVAAYYVTDGKDICIERQPGATDSEVLICLIGAGMGALLNQRGVLPLHGSALVVGDHGVALVGTEGAGKSTLVAALDKKGYRLLADDVCAVSLNDEHVPVITPGFAMLKLWADAAEKLEMSSVGMQRVLPTLDKFFLRSRNEAVQSPVPLKTVYVLDVSDAKEFSVQPLTGTDKLGCFVNNTYGYFALDGLGRRPEHFSLCATVGNSVSVCKVTGPREWDRFDRLVQVLEDHFKS